MTKHLMVDVETLGVGSAAPIFQIAAVEFSFEPQQIYRKFQVHVNLLDVILKTGFLPQRGAVEFWQKQSYDPGNVFATLMSLREALELFTLFESQETYECIWANSPAFDLALIDAHYRAIGKSAPWIYKDEADFRTVRHLLKILDIQEPSKDREPTHDALSDCLDQINHLWAMVELLK